MTREMRPEEKITDEPTRTLIYNAVWRDSPLSRADLARMTGLTKSTVSVVVGELVSRGMLKETGRGGTTPGGGRPPVLLEVNPESRIVAGVHVGVRRTTAVIADALGRELAVHASPTVAGTPEETLAAVAAEIKHLLASASIPLSGLSAVGLAIPGMVDFHTGLCVLAPNLGWRDVPVSRLLEDALDVPVFVSNTVQAMAVAEAGTSRGEPREDLVLLYAGTGVGSAAVTRGRLFRGSSGFAGEIGHVSVGSGIRCACGKVGCLETMLSAEAIVRRALEAGVSGRRGVPLTPETIGWAAEAGDAAAQRVLTQVGAELGSAASWLVQIFNPRTLVVAGGISAMGDVLMNPLKDAIRGSAICELGGPLTVRRSRIERGGKLRGAVLVALQQLEELPAELEDRPSALLTVQEVS